MIDLIKSVWANSKTHLIYGGIIVVCLICMMLSFKSCSDAHNEMKRSNNNIEALVDSIDYYKAKNGDIVAEKKLLEGDMSTLKIANNELAKSLKNMKIKNAEQAAYIKSVVDNGAVDTLWQHDTVFKYIPVQFREVRAFDFSNQWRTLTGNVTIDNENIALNILEDKVLVDYTLAIKDNTVFVHSSNPYINYSEISGITLPKQTRKHFLFGVQAGIGVQYGIMHQSFDVGPYFGVGLKF